MLGIVGQRGRLLSEAVKNTGYLLQGKYICSGLSTPECEDVADDGHGIVTAPLLRGGTEYVRV
ncbi:hypothetical protein SNOG_07291 [Parastagonospora nodorum SN15]|uniref:Uncharacterized protein n=1 Tax=Phaeosphaeria nodorum (strain SN15 / ATCC MYA-4574 / FGSC 10173) TaxID=321614 RepID=Q0ULS3_PHANO|nr:hypothetical protein SNOG_07291 [Parastagonospora nodorum SN15]EAT84757.1 hypothetical protein SNOG_07291 [Parastagonospora nodorum SN15]